MIGTASFGEELHLIMVEDQRVKSRYLLTEKDMETYFNPEQRQMLKDGYVIICNSFHGNRWVKGTNATACDMTKATNDRMGA